MFKPIEYIKGFAMLSLITSLVNTCREKPKMAFQSSSSRGRGKAKGKISKLFLNLESGPSTLQTGSSTQQQSSLQTSKQTKADYAFPIKTLIAFQEQGLAKLPKKTLASIADEDSDQDLPSLDQLIQKQKTGIITVNPKPGQKTQYLQKSNSKFILNIELEYWDKNHNKISSKVFYPNFHFEPITPLKNQTFYEFILVEEIKKFSANFDPIGFNYWDYVRA